MFSSLDACGAYHVVSIYQPFSTFNAIWISQRWECVQQDAGHGHEEGGQGLLDVLPG